MSGQTYNPFWARRMSMTPDQQRQVREEVEESARRSYDAATQVIAQGGEAAKKLAGQAGTAVDKFKAHAQSEIDRRLGRINDPPVTLRGPLPAVPPSGIRRDDDGDRYLVDLNRPEDIAAMTTCADRNCRHSYINPYPVSGLGRRVSYDEVKAGIADLAGGKPVNVGPHVTFVNDDPRNPSPNQPLTTPTARTAAAAIVQSGAGSANINSTTGGRHSERSRHYGGQAVDINRVDGARVRPATPARALQDAALMQPNLYENFGPSYQVKNRGKGLAPIRDRAVIRTHQDHIHLSGRR